MPYYNRRANPILPFIEQDVRVCENCDRKFLSGVIVVERGYPVRALCANCAHLHSEKGWDEKDT